MSGISILAVANGAEDDAAVVAIAAELAARHASKAVVIDAFSAFAPAVAPAFAGRAMTPGVFQALEEEKDEAHRRIAQTVQAQARRFGLEAGPAMTLASREATVWATMMRELPLIDLVVVGQSAAAGAGVWLGPLGEALMEARTPVFVARGEAPPAGRPAAVAWDGSFEAGRSVRAALPLLKDASRVAILQNTDEIAVDAGARADPARLALYLSGHGIAVDKTIHTRGRKVGQALIDGARDFDAALLVAGAYGHSRLEEAVRGGATRALLHADAGPHLLLTH